MTGADIAMSGKVTDAISMNQAGVVVVAALLWALSTPAQACLAENFQDALIHSELPNPFPKNAIVAEVVIERAPESSLWKSGLRAKVTKWHFGGTGREVILQNDISSSCDAPFKNGRTGIIVGRERGVRNGVLVVEAFLVSAVDGYRGNYGSSVLTYKQALELVRRRIIRRRENVRLLQEESGSKDSSSH
jgi:hypothetical protein